MYQEITLVGNIGSDVEMRYTPSGVPVSSFSLAVNKSWNDQEGNRQQKTTWFRVTAWRKLAEITAEHLTKGRQVLVVGEMQDAHAWSDKEGKPQASLEVTAQTIRFLGSRPESDAEAPAQTEQSHPVLEEEEIPF